MAIGILFCIIGAIVGLLALLCAWGDNREGFAFLTICTTVFLMSGILLMSLETNSVDACQRWHRYDLNHDGNIDMRDIVVVAQAYGSEQGDPRYSPRLDFNHNKCIDMHDVATIAHYFGIAS